MNTCGMWTCFADLWPKHFGIPELPWLANLFIAVWLWMFGANVGSFMNVVVFRLPRRSSITLPRSKCPRCGHKIRWYDNIPVVSWLLLRAKCRDCQGRISARYPLVEATVAFVFVALAFLEPMRVSDHQVPYLLTLVPRRPQTMSTLFLMYFYQLILWCTTLCAGLISFDVREVPRKLFGPALLVGFVAPLACLQLRPIPYAPVVHWPHSVIAAADGIAGAVVGAMLGFVIYAAALHRRREHRNPTMLPLAITGLALGWQAVCGLAIATSIAELLAAIVGRIWRGANRISLTAMLAVAIPIYVVCWTPILKIFPGLSADASILTFVLATLTVTCCSSGRSWLRRARRRRVAPISNGVAAESAAPSATNELRTADEKSSTAAIAPTVGAASNGEAEAGIDQVAEDPETL